MLRAPSANTRRRIVVKSEPVAVDVYCEKAMSVASVEQIELGNFMVLSITGSGGQVGRTIETLRGCHIGRAKSSGPKRSSFTRRYCDRRFCRGAVLRKTLEVELRQQKLRLLQQRLCCSCHLLWTKKKGPAPPEGTLCEFRFSSWHSALQLQEGRASSATATGCALCSGP